MILIILAIAVIAIIIYSIYYDERNFEGKNDKLFGISVFSVFTIIFLFCFGLIGNGIFGDYRLIDTKTTHKIVSLTNKDKISGSFVLGCGGISQEEYYFTFIKIEDNIYIRKKYSTEETRIHETNTHKPKVIKRIYKKISSFWFFPSWLSPTNTKYTLKVPKGTIIKEFRIGEENVQ